MTETLEIKGGRAVMTRLPQHIWEAVRKAAAEDKRSISRQVEKLVEEALVQRMRRPRRVA